MRLTANKQINIPLSGLYPRITKEEESKIERAVERKINLLDRALKRGDIDQDLYEDLYEDVKEWSQNQYNSFLI